MRKQPHRPQGRMSQRTLANDWTKDNSVAKVFCSCRELPMTGKVEAGH